MPSLEEVEVVDDEKENCDARNKAALLIGEVLDEACTVVNVALKVGWFKDKKSGRLSVSGHTDLFEVLQGDNDTVNEESKDIVAHLTTSTPQKDETLKSKPGTSFIGQGDEEIDMVSKEDETRDSGEEIKQDIEEVVRENEELMFSSCIVTNVMDKLVETAFPNVPEIDEDGNFKGNEIQQCPELFLNKLMALSTALDGASEGRVVEFENDENPKILEEFCYSFLENVYEDVGNDIAFCIEEDTASFNDIDQIKMVVQAEVHTEIEENLDIDNVTESSNQEAERLEKLEAARYEDAYLSLNRDFEQSSQCSDDDGDPILQDPKSPMQEVTLSTMPTENDDNVDENLSFNEAEKEKKELAAISAVSGASGSRKSRSSLMSRCRSQGARLLSCLRGWWHRKTPGKRKEPRAPGSIRGVCPMSPCNRRRSGSLLGQRRTITVPSSVVWKFNTVNESLVNSTKWKEYTFEVNPEECDEPICE